VNQLDKSVSSKLEATVARQIQAQFQTTGKQVLQVRHLHWAFALQCIASFLELVAFLFVISSKVAFVHYRVLISSVGGTQIQF